MEYKEERSRLSIVVGPDNRGKREIFLKALGFVESGESTFSRPDMPFCDIVISPSDRINSIARGMFISVDIYGLEFISAICDAAADCGYNYERMEHPNLMCNIVLDNADNIYWNIFIHPTEKQRERLIYRAR